MLKRYCIPFSAVYNEDKLNEAFSLEKGLMQMRSKNPDTMKKIIEFVEEYYLRYNQSPSTRIIGENVGLSKGMVYNYLLEMNEKGMIAYDGKTITNDRINKINTGFIGVPIVGSIVCGAPNLAEENIEEYIPLPEKLFGKGDFFILRAKGQSMIEAGIDDGDLVIVRMQNTAEDGQIVVALVDDEATLKRFYKETGRIRLHPENSNMKDIFVPNCSIQGVAVKVLKDLL